MIKKSLFVLAVSILIFVFKVGQVSALSCGYCNGAVCVPCTDGRISVGECTSNSQCAGAPGVVCGNGKCETGETSFNCPNDCFTPAETCGNGICGGSENYGNCPEDCDAPQPTAVPICKGSVAKVAGDADSNSITITAGMVNECSAACPGSGYIYASLCTCSSITTAGGCNTNCVPYGDHYGAYDIVSFTPPTCGTVQMDIGCRTSQTTNGSFTFRSKTSSVACNSSSTTPPSIPPVATQPPVRPTTIPTRPPSSIVTKAYCSMNKIYTNNWVELTPTAFKGLSAGVQVYFCVNGVTNSSVFDSGRFTINGVLRPASTLNRPGSDDFCDLYTIPANTYSFKVQGEIHHTVLGWL